MYPFFFLKKIMKGCDFLSKKRNYRRLLFVFLIADIIAAGTMGYKEVKNSIPDTLYVRSGNEDGISKMLDNPLVTYPETLNVADSGTYRIPCSLLGVVPLKDVKVETVEDKWVSVCGMPIGLYMDTEGVLIVDTGEIIGSDGIPCEPAANIAKSGDYILQVDGEAVTSKKDLISRIHDCDGKPVTLLVKRGEEEVPISIDPVLGEDQKYKLGIWVRDNTQGIGTLTYVEEDGSYGALGHGISDTDTGELLDISGGELYQAQIVSVLKGTKGNPGELSGYIDYDDSKKIGTINVNTEKGIFGSVNEGCMYKLPLTSMEVGLMSISFLLEHSSLMTWSTISTLSSSVPIISVAFPFLKNPPVLTSFVTLMRSLFRRSTTNPSSSLCTIAKIIFIMKHLLMQCCSLPAARPLLKPQAPVSV